MLWRPEEEQYLLLLRDSCDALGKHFLEKHKHYSTLQTRFRIPAIVLSSVSGVASFGTTTFPTNAQRWVSIVVGGVNIVIAILNTMEAYMKLGDMLSRSLTAQMNFKKLADDISCELAIPVDVRNTNGITFLRDAFARYQQIIDQAPPMDTHHLIVHQKDGLIPPPSEYTDATVELDEKEDEEVV